MNLNPNLTKAEAKWLLEEYKPKATLRIDGHTMDTLFLPARRLLTGNLELQKPSCGCEFKVFSQVTNSILNQFEGEIKKLLEEPIKEKPKRGRTKRKKL